MAGIGEEDQDQSDLCEQLLAFVNDVGMKVRMQWSG